MPSIESQPTPEFIMTLMRSLDSRAREEFRKPEQWALQQMMALCGMDDYPAVTGDPNGERCSGEMICEKCGNDYYTHPLDWRLIGYGNVPFLNILCDGRRVKL